MKSNKPLFHYYLSLGANLGDRMKSLSSAREFLAGLGRIEQLSPVYQTSPVGLDQAPFFLNAVLHLASQLEPADLLREIKSYEKKAGRDQEQGHNRSRLIDIDILAAPGLTVDLPGLQIPHPRLHGRLFVLKPLADIAPGLNHPLLQKSISSLLAELKSNESVEFYCSFPAGKDRD